MAEEQEQKKSNFGWICARCGKSLSPSVKQCECVPEWEELKKAKSDD